MRNILRLFKGTYGRLEYLGHHQSTVEVLKSSLHMDIRNRTPRYSPHSQSPRIDHESLLLDRFTKFYES